MRVVRAAVEMGRDITRRDGLTRNRRLRHRVMRRRLADRLDAHGRDFEGPPGMHIAVQSTMFGLVRIRRRRQLRAEFDRQRRIDAPIA